jgi:hypothetical protein
MPECGVELGLRGIFDEANTASERRQVREQAGRDWVIAPVEHARKDVGAAATGGKWAKNERKQDAAARAVGLTASGFDELRQSAPNVMSGADLPRNTAGRSLTW